MRKKKQKQETPAGTPSRIMPLDIQQKEFRLAFRGYNERDVDEFLDRLTESMEAVTEENRRLHEQLEAGGSQRETSPWATTPEREADDIVVRAREEAERILAEAREQANAVSWSSGSVDVSGIPSFLTRERDFLQGMAAMIQEHAESVREMAREAKGRTRQSYEPPAEEPVAASAAGVAPAPTPGETIELPEAEAAEAEASGAIDEEPAAATPTGDTPQEEPEEEASPEAPSPEQGEDPVGVPESVEQDASGRSLRELFWGGD